VKILHNNLTAHSAGKPKDWLVKYRWEVLQNPPHNPELASSNLFLFLLGPLKILGRNSFSK